MSSKNNRSVLHWILAGVAIILATISVYQWQIIEKNEKEIDIHRQALDKSTKLFIHYQNANADVLLNNVDESTFPVKNTLIYRFRVDMCDECIRQDLETLYTFQEIVGKQNIMLLPAFPENRNTTIYLSNLLHNFNYRNVSDSLLGFPTHQKTNEVVRYMAYINANGKLTSIFYPMKSKQNLTQLFLQQMVSKFK